MNNNLESALKTLYESDKEDIPSLLLELGFTIESALVGMDLCQTEFIGNHLAGVNFSGANLTEAIFEGADLSQADFSNANLTKAIFRDANLTGANISNANIDGAVFENALVDGITFGNGNIETLLVEGARFTDESVFKLTKRFNRPPVSKERIMLVDDHELVRSGVKRILEDQNYNIVAAAKCGEEAIDMIEDFNPSFILMDLNMPGIGGLEATRQIVRNNPSIRVCGLSVHKEGGIPSRMIKNGASGFLSKSSEPEEIFVAIDRIGKGGRYFSQDVEEQIVIESLKPSDKEPITDLLSERELEISLCIGEGAKVIDIAAHLNLSAKTISTYRYRIFEKLNINSDIELVHLLIRAKLITSKL